MAKLVTVHRTLAAEVPQIVGYLESRNLHPVVLDDVEARGTYRSQAHEVRIAVPETERDMAVHILAERERKDEARLRPLIKTSNAIVFLLIVILAILALVGLLDTHGRWFAGLSILAAALAALALIRHAWPRKPRP